MIRKSKVAPETVRPAGSGLLKLNWTYRVVENDVAQFPVVLMIASGNESASSTVAPVPLEASVCLRGPVKREPEKIRFVWTVCVALGPELKPASETAVTASAATKAPAKAPAKAPTRRVCPSRLSGDISGR